MPKAEKGTPKWIANQWRKKGMSKLRWYCGLCGVACLDENGFKCHLAHEKHKKNEEAANAKEMKGIGYHVDAFSRKFENDFMQLMVKNHLNEKALAHDLYEELIPDDRPMKTMVKTCWKTLGNFVSYMRECGKIHAERGVKGWKLTIFQQMIGNEGYIEADEPIYEKPKSHWNQKFSKYGSKKDSEAEAVGLATSYAGAGGNAAVAAGAPEKAEIFLTGTDRLADVKVQGFALKKKEAAEKSKVVKGAVSSVFGSGAGDGEGGGDGNGGDTAPPSKKPRLVFSAHDERGSGSSSSGSGSSSSSSSGSFTGGQAKEVWPQPHMVVKVYDKSGSSATKGWHKRKAAVRRVLSGSSAPSSASKPTSKKSSSTAKVQVEIEALDSSGDVAVVPMSVLETVLPKPGNRVLICCWRHEHNGKLVRLKVGA
jgi:DNA/RNA-binding protein KIN17